MACNSVGGIVVRVEPSALWVSFGSFEGTAGR